MSRFEKELSGALGASWKAYAEKEVASMQKQADDGEIGLDANRAAYWICSGNYLPEDCVERLLHTTFSFDPEATARAREKQVAEDIAEYRRRRKGHKPSEEELFEMRAAFGKGETVVDIITGDEYEL